MAVAKKLPSGSWRVRAYGGKDAEGKNIYKSFTASTKKQAELAALEWQTTYHPTSESTSKMTFKDAINAYVESGRSDYSPLTVKTYHKYARNYFTDIQHLQLSRLTEAQIKASARPLSDLAPKTQKSIICFFTAVLKKYRPDLSVDLTPPKVKYTPPEIPLEDDLKVIFAAVKGKEIELPVLLAAWLGLRQSEVRGLRHKDIIGGKYLRVSRAIVDGEDAEGNNVPCEKGGKTEAAARVLPLPEYIASLIPDGKPDEHIVKLTGTAIYKQFSRVCKNAGLPHYTFHSLRHANATVMLDLNVPDKYIATRGGWGSQIYKKVYQHATPAGANAVADIIDAKFSSLIDD